jgi:hypothetical protein
MTKKCNRAGKETKIKMNMCLPPYISIVKFHCRDSKTNMKPDTRSKNNSENVEYLLEEADG